LYIDQVFGARGWDELDTEQTLLLIFVAFLAAKVGAMTKGERTAMTLGAGMVPRGEVGIVVAMIGLSMGTIGLSAYSVMVIVSIATTSYAPFLIRTVVKAEAKNKR